MIATVALFKCETLRIETGCEEWQIDQRNAFLRLDPLRQGFVDSCVFILAAELALGFVAVWESSLTLFERSSQASLVPFAPLVPTCSVSSVPL